jgi:hypothetical protein
MTHPSNVPHINGIAVMRGVVAPTDYVSRYQEDIKTSTLFVGTKKILMTRNIDVLAMGNMIIAALSIWDS